MRSCQYYVMTGDAVRQVIWHSINAINHVIFVKFSAYMAPKCMSIPLECIRYLPVTVNDSPKVISYQITVVTHSILVKITV